MVKIWMKESFKTIGRRKNVELEISASQGTIENTDFKKINIATTNLLTAVSKSKA